MTQESSQYHGVQLVPIGSQEHGQRVDNFLFSYLKTVPKSHIYRLLRSGQIRADGKRIKPQTKLSSGQTLRLPPLNIATAPAPSISHARYQQLCRHILLETEQFIALNKPANLAVHAGSGVDVGVIEILKAHHGENLELAHRLDRDTSGILLIAKGRHNLNQLQALFKARQIEKTYLALLAGKAAPKTVVTAALERYLLGSERRVRVSKNPAAKAARSEFVLRQYYRQPQATGGASWCAVRITSGRTHQIRVHAASKGMAIAGDSKYSTPAQQQIFKKFAVKRLCLHAWRLAFTLGDAAYNIEAPLPDDLTQVLNALGKTQQ